MLSGTQALAEYIALLFSFDLLSVAVLDVNFFLILLATAGEFAFLAISRPSLNSLRLLVCLRFLNPGIVDECLDTFTIGLQPTSHIISFDKREFICVLHVC